MSTRLALLLPCFVWLSCAHDGGTGIQRSFNKDAEIFFLNSSAAWDEDQVVGPVINISERSDGTWAGQVQGQIFDVSVYPSRAAGPNLTMKWGTEGDHSVITAAWRGQLYRWEIHADKFLFRGPRQSFTLQNRGNYTWGPRGELRFEGQAQQPNPPMPQFAFTLLGTFAALDDVRPFGSGTF